MTGQEEKNAFISISCQWAYIYQVEYMPTFKIL